MLCSDSVDGALWVFDHSKASPAVLKDLASCLHGVYFDMLPTWNAAIKACLRKNKGMLTFVATVGGREVSAAVVEVDKEAHECIIRLMATHQDHQQVNGRPTTPQCHVACDFVTERPRRLRLRTERICAATPRSHSRACSPHVL